MPQPIDAPPVPPPEFGDRRADSGRRYGRAFDRLPWHRIACWVAAGRTAVLLAMPLFAPGAADDACRSVLCFTSGAIRQAGALLPPFVAAWIDAFASNPSLFWALALPLPVGLWIAGALARRVRRHAARRPRGGVAAPPRRPAARYRSAR